MRMLALLAVLFESGCSLLVPEGPGGTVGDSIQVGEVGVATLIQSLEGRVPELHRVPENDRYSLYLRIDGFDGSVKMVKLGSGLKAGDYLHAARLIADDGTTLWFHGQEPMAYNYRSGDLRRGVSMPGPRRPLFRSVGRTDMLEAAPTLEAQYRRAAFVKTEDKALRLLTHRGAKGLLGPLEVTRLAADGGVMWKADTGLLDVEQVLPGKTVLALVGKRPPAKPNDVVGPTLTMIDIASGKTRHVDFWGKR